MLRERYFLIYLTSRKGKRNFISWERNFFEIIRRKSINYIQNARNVESSLKFAKLERFPELGNWKVTRIPIMRVWIPKLMLLLFTINLRRNDEQTNIFRSEWIQNGFFGKESSTVWAFYILFQENQAGNLKFQFEILRNPASSDLY